MAGLVERPTPASARGRDGIHGGGSAARRTADPAGFRDAGREPGGLGADGNLATVSRGDGRGRHAAEEALMRRQSLRTLAAACAVTLVNIALVSPLFRVEYTDQMGSIEAAYISLARYILDHFPDLQWFPLWYTGVPYQNTYPPLLPLSMAALAAAARIPPGLAYHVLTAALYCLGPVALFWLVHRLSGSRMQALFAALAWSLFSPSCFLIPEVRRDALNYFDVRRFQVLSEYGEGPHIASMALMLVALALLDAAVRKSDVRRWLLCSVALAAAVMFNWIGAFALAVCILCYLLARGRGWLRAAGAGGYAYLLVS